MIITIWFQSEGEPIWTVIVMSLKSANSYQDWASRSKLYRSCAVLQNCFCVRARDLYLLLLWRTPSSILIRHSNSYHVNIILKIERLHSMAPGQLTRVRVQPSDIVVSTSTTSRSQILGPGQSEALVMTLLHGSVSWQYLHVWVLLMNNECY